MRVSTADDVKTAIELIHNHHQHERYLVQCYMAFCINCAENPDLVDLKVQTAVQFGIANVDKDDPNAVAYIKRRFRSWVIAQGFQNLIEVTSSYLTYVFKLLLSLEIGYFNRKINLSKKQEWFDRKGVHDKIKTLENEFGFEPVHKDVISTMNNVRNAIVHNQGWVAAHHCNQASQLVLRWKGTKLRKRIEGAFVEVSDDHRGSVLSAGDECLVEVLMKEKTFNVGERVQISPYEIGDMVWCLSGVMQDIKEKVIGRAETAAHKGARRQRAWLDIPTEEVAARMS